MAAAPGVKFCGLTRPEDAAEAARLGAAYVGAIFAGGPRERPAHVAARVLAAAGTGEGAPQRVGVFGADFQERLGLVLAELHLDIVQLHADPTPADVSRARERFDGQVWAVLRVEGAMLPAGAAALAEVADAILLDARAEGGALGGTGRQIPWADLRGAVDPLRARTTIVLAGGLNATNVQEAVAALSPGIVDVSSGVECEPGVKDHSKMAAFAAALRRSR